MRGVSLDADTLARLSKDRHDRIIGKDQIENGGILAGNLIGEAPALDMYSVEPVDGSVLGIDIKVTLIDVQQMPLYLKMATIDTAGRNQQGQHDQKPRETSGYITAITIMKLHND